MKKNNLALIALLTSSLVQQVSAGKLHNAVQSDSLQAVQKAMAYGCNINKKTTDGYQETALHIAANRGHLKIVQYLCAIPGIRLNEKECWGRTPLHLAVHDKSLEIVRYLCALPGVKLNEQDHNKETPLHCAVNQENLEIIQCLCSRFGTRPNEQDSNGQTPLHIAAKSNHLEIVRYFCSLPKIKLDEKDNEGKTPFETTRNPKIKEIIKTAILKQKKEQQKKEARERKQFNERAAFISQTFGPGKFLPSIQKKAYGSINVVGANLKKWFL